MSGCGGCSSGGCGCHSNSGSTAAAAPSSNSSGGGCGGGGCSGCPRSGSCGARAPIALLAFSRDQLQSLIADGRPTVILVNDPSRGLTLGDVPAEKVDFPSMIDPLTGWTYEVATKLSTVGILPSPGTVPVQVAAIPTPNITEALAASRVPYPAFFALVRIPTEAGMTFGLRPTPYPRLTPQEYQAVAKQIPAQWPPSEAILGPAGTTIPVIFSGGFLADPVSYACEVFHQRPFLYSGKAPAQGQGLYVHLPFRGHFLGQPFIRMFGAIVNVGPLPEPGFTDPTLGPSYFATCQCGKDHPREDLLKELGTLHGQRFTAVLRPTPEYLGRCPPIDGQWDAVFVCDDTKQLIWHIERLSPRPIDQWLA